MPPWETQKPWVGQHSTSESEIEFGVEVDHKKEHERDLFSIRNDKRHGQKRRHLAHLYTMTSILKAEDCLDDCLRDFSSVLQDCARNGTELDLSATLHRCV